MNIGDIEKLAKLSKIHLEDGEKQSLLKEMDAILKYVEQIKEVSAKGDDAPNVGLNVNTMREDGEPHASGIYTEALIREAPRKEGKYVKVKKIL